MAGCVSFSWIATWSASDTSSPCCCLVPAQEILQRRRGEEELLPQPQLVAGGRVVARIEHARDRFEAHAVGERADVVAAVEVVEAAADRSRARTTGAAY